jgi:hypothetical protein
VEHYSFEVFDGDAVVSTRSAVAITDLRTAWQMITEMAQGADIAASYIRVTDETGAIVILTGVATARLHAGTTIFPTIL